MSAGEVAELAKRVLSEAELQYEEEIRVSLARQDHEGAADAQKKLFVTPVYDTRLDRAVTRVWSRFTAGG